VALSGGQRLGPYEVVAPIGAGGMGEVYQAHDTKLGRDVAIKVLPEAFAHDPERLSRFQREAKMLASLNHPNIATIHGLEQSGDTSYLVMEMVSGETLAERVKSGPVGVEEALKIATQIAEALEAAHEKSIIHRDLKPANVKVTPEGKVKVLDFGLAKAFEGDAANDDLSNSPTLSAAATMQGVILGTAAYMSPEQARGKSVDKRTDIWAFGCVLCELLTGKQTFRAETTTEILAAVLREEPDWQALPAATPLKIRDLLRRCLQKDKALRLRDAGDARMEIQEALDAQAAETVSGAASQPGWTWREVAIVGITALVFLAIGGFAAWNLKLTSARPVTRTVINLPPGDQLAARDFPAIAISPDESQLAYVAIHAGTQQIFLRALDSLEAKPLAGTEGASTPFFSPDGEWLGFYATDGTLKKVSVTGGAAVALINAPNLRGASWGSQHMIAFAPINPAILEQMPDAGGTSQALTHLEKGETDQGWPDFLPGGKALLFVAGHGGDWSNAQVVVLSVKTGERRNLIQGAIMPRYASSGHLVYAQGGNLMAVPFDPQRLGVTGAAVPVIEGVLQSTSSGAAQYSFSATGSLVYASGAVQTTQGRLVWVSRNGAEQPLPAPMHGYKIPRLSPDGRRIAVTIDEQESQLWLYDFSRGTFTRLTFEGDDNYAPAWTPDGKRIGFRSNKEGPLNIFWQLADGSGGRERLTTSNYPDTPDSWSPDGQLLAFEERKVPANDIWVLNMKDRKARPFLHSSAIVSGSSFSPDGHWLAYVSGESGRFEIYVQSYPGPGGKYQVSTEGGTEPVWNRNGRELFYRSGDKMMAVGIATQPNFAAGTPRMLFRGTYTPSPAGFPNYDVSADGQRFLMVKPAEQSSSSSLTQIVVVQNWFEELKRLVPTGK